MPDGSAAADDGARAAARQPSLARDRNFLAYLAARGLNIMGTQVLTVAVGWQVYQLTGDPFDLGLIGLSQFGPVFALVLVAGVVADRIDRRAIIAACSAVHAIAMALLFVYTQSGEEAVWPFFALLFVHGIARAFVQPPLVAILANIVAPERFPTAVAVASSVTKSAHLAGPPIGGILLAAIGSSVYLAALAMFAVSGIAASLMTAAPMVKRAGIGLSTVLGGFAYVWQKKLVLGAMSADIVAVLFAGVMGILPVFAADILQVGPEGLGLMRAMPAAGGLAVGVALARMPAPRRMGPTLFAAMAVFGLSTIAFSLSDVLWVSLAALVVYGGADMVSVYIRQTLIQLATPDEMRGRVSAVHSVTATGSNEVGDFRAGLTAGWIGTVPAVLLGGVATLVVTALWWKIFPALRKVDRLDALRNA